MSFVEPPYQFFGIGHEASKRLGIHFHSVFCFCECALTADHPTPSVILVKPKPQTKKQNMEGNDHGTLNQEVVDKLGEKYEFYYKSPDTTPGCIVYIFNVPGLEYHRVTYCQDLNEVFINFGPRGAWHDRWSLDRVPIDNIIEMVEEVILQKQIKKVGTSYFFFWFVHMYLAIIEGNFSNWRLLMISKKPVGFYELEEVDDREWEDVLKKKLMMEYNEHLNSSGSDFSFNIQQALYMSPKLLAKVDKVFKDMGYEQGNWNNAIRWMRRGIK